MTLSRPLDEAPGPGVLERARLCTDMSHQTLWVHYVALGGSFAPARLERSLMGADEMVAHEYNLVVDALNERFTDMGLDALVRYAA